MVVRQGVTQKAAIRRAVEMLKISQANVLGLSLIHIWVGADIKIECTGCSHIVMMSRYNFNKRLKKVLERAEQEEN